MKHTIDSPFVHRFVPATQLHRPVLLLLHGNGGNENDLIGLGESLLPGAALLSPRGNVTENGMRRFFRRLSDGVFDVEDLKARSLELALFVENSKTEYGLSDRPIVAVGYSNGANIASGLLFARPDLLAGACLLRPMVPYNPDPDPDLSQKRILILAGSRDTTMPRNEPDRLAEMYLQFGASVRLKHQPAGHALTNDDLTEAAGWLSTSFAS
ncbi:MAG: alpha/beta hydrolase [candidate division Zixibacteria bacterium]|nr:alpha/beta hydrolase [candidate division Zixibacteria bacterium]